jgi:predicted enzyme related to lactoylglutathione lyase
MIKLAVTSVFVTDQAHAHDFYTQVLGFEVRQDMPAGDARWLTVAAAGQDVELLLEPNDNPIAKTYQDGLLSSGIAAMTLATDDIAAEHERLTGLGVVFTMPPTPMGPVTVATFEDTCGNLLSLVQFTA